MGGGESIIIIIIIIIIIMHDAHLLRWRKGLQRKGPCDKSGIRVASRFVLIIM